MGESGAAAAGVAGGECGKKEQKGGRKRGADAASRADAGARKKR